ncbi:MAG: S-layer homology domain-containing protein, partial [Eubacteriales bacterium]
MRNLKKFLALLLSVMMIATTAVIVSAEDATDYTEAAEVLVSTGALKGYTDGKLHLEDDVQRYQMALFIARMMTGDVNDTLWSNINTTSFTDIGKLSQYVGAISFVTGEGVIKGRSETIFDPYAQITYQDAVTMLVRALGYQNLSYPYGFIQAANKIGLTGGIEGVEWSEPLTRGEVTQLLYNTIKFVSDFGTGDGSYTYEGDCFDKFDSFAIVDAYIADYNAEAGYVKFSSGDQATFEKLGIEEPSDEILGSWYELFMLEDKVIKIDACEVVDAEAGSYMDPAGEEIDEEDLDDDYVVVTVYETRENGKVGVVKVSSYIAGEAPAIGYTYTAGQKSTKVDVALEWETYRVVSLKDGKAALKLDGDKEATVYTYDYGKTLNGIKTAEEIEAVLTEALGVGGVVSVVLYEDAIIDAVAGEVENPIILILDLKTLLEIVGEDDECTGFLSADVYSDAFEGKKTIEISAISGDGFSYDYNKVFDPNADDDIALQKAIQKTIVAINNKYKDDKYIIFTGTKDKFDKWTLVEAPLYFGKLKFKNEVGEAQIDLYEDDDYGLIKGRRGEWTLDTSATKTASVFYDFNPAAENDDEGKDALTGKTYT